MKNRLLHTGPFILLIYLLLVLVHGYIFGHNDMVEVLPYALLMQDSTLYPHDFYLQHIQAAIPNERYLFSLLLSLGGKSLDYFCLPLHFLSSMSLLYGLYYVAGLFIRGNMMRYIGILVVLVFLYGINLGGNELYYNMMVSSLMAKAIAVWALYFMLRKKITFGVLLLIPAILLHPVAAGQLGLIFLGIRAWQLVYSRNKGILKKEVVAWLLFFLIGGTWVYLLQRHFASAQISNALLFEIFHFRLPHHYLPSAFPLKSWVILLPLFLLALYVARHRATTVAFLSLSLTGMIIYTLAVEVFQSSFFLSSQWFKVSIWVKALSVFILFGYLDERVFPGLLYFLKKNQSYFLLAGFVLVLFLLIRTPSPFDRVPHDWPWQHAFDEAQSIAVAARSSTEKDAVFVVPMGMTSFKYYSRRSLYVDYKSMVHRKDVLPAWYKRIQQIYGVRWRGNFEDNTQLGNEYYFSRSEENLRALKSAGIDYFVTRHDHKLELPVLTANDGYKIYVIP